jgi:hypothetical protein
MSPVAEAVRDGVLPGRVWLYANYHCNLACTYCLTESFPKAARRELGQARMVALAAEARALGFTALGVTGGEPFLLPYLPELLVELASILPLVCLSTAPCSPATASSACGRSPSSRPPSRSPWTGPTPSPTTRCGGRRTSARS